MGLDMYLCRRTYVKNWSHMPKEERHTITVKLGGKSRKDIKSKRISCIEEEMIVWRKANAIHKWFVDNCGDGEDDCRQMDVSKEQLGELLDLVTQVLSEKNPELLPTQEGFFFGSTDYDASYWDDLRETKKELEKILKEKNNGDFYYQASW